MKPVVHRRVFGRIALFALVATGVFLAPPSSAQSTLYPTGYVYLDTEGCSLPFQDNATILEALRTGEIVEREQMSRGVAKNIKLLVQYKGVRFKAVMRLIDVTEKEKTGSQRMVVKYRDSYIFESAA